MRENPQTLPLVQTSLREYGLLVNGSKSLIDGQVALLGKVSRHGNWWDHLKEGKNPFGSGKQVDREQGWSESLWKFASAWGEYARDQQGLEQRVATFEGELKASREIDRPLAKAEGKQEIEQLLRSLLDRFRGFFR